MRTIEEVKKSLLNEIYRIHGNNLTMTIVKKHIDEILEINKTNESVKGDWISRADTLQIVEKELSLNMGYDADIVLLAVKKQLSELPTACNDGWIPCEKELPQRQDSLNSRITYYLIQGRWERIYKGFLDQDGKWINEHGNKIVGAKYWREMPQPYKENENENT